MTDNTTTNRVIPYSPAERHALNIEFAKELVGGDWRGKKIADLRKALKLLQAHMKDKSRVF